ncbi:MAG: peptidoglycan DD-metalloendopeptidase family protein [Anaerolineales bacterium]
MFQTRALTLIKSTQFWSAVIALVVLGVAIAGVRARAVIPAQTEVIEAPPPTSAPSLLAVEDLPPFSQAQDTGITRLSDVHTIIPTRPRLGLLMYQVQRGDTLFGIADKFGLKPESILWGNWYELDGDPHFIAPGQDLNILPVDGTLHRWSAGEGLNGVASFYGVTAQDILDWPGNDLDRGMDPANPDIDENAALIVPGGRRDPPSWQLVRITRSNPAVASILGPGACSAVSNGPIGDGAFGWPTSSTGVTGNPYIPGVHEAIDIGGGAGSGIFAADDGVVVYAGWNDWGYGYTVVLDHGNGWQTLYAHNSQINVGCGQEIYQGNVIAGMGCTGSCTGTHLHFEMRSDVFGRVNPLNFLP